MVLYCPSLQKGRGIFGVSIYHIFSLFWDSNVFSSLVLHQFGISLVLCEIYFLDASVCINWYKNWIPYFFDLLVLICLVFAGVHEPQSNTLSTIATSLCPRLVLYFLNKTSITEFFLVSCLRQFFIAYNIVIVVA